MKVVPPTTSLHLVQPVMVGDPALQNGNYLPVREGETPVDSPRR